MDSKTQAQTSKYQFKAEIKQLLDILVHSLYTSREIFLRELVSNASDALDKLRFEITKGSEINDKDLPLEIKITFDEKKKLLTICDTGIGMTKNDLIENIGTIAKSGSADFLKMLADNKADAANIIGRFGVGFYSVFMVAEKVEITTQSFIPGEKAVTWSSQGLGDFDITEVEGEIKRGTTIDVYLKEDAKEFAEKYRIEGVVKKYSNFISFPIFVDKDKVNNIKAIWREPKSSITNEEYNEFYKFLTYDADEPMDVLHASVDAPIQYYSLLFIPKKENEFFRVSREDYGLDLYVRRVLIQHKNKDILPEYLGFVKGVVDSEDLPLNISRETLQENNIFSKISKNITAQVYSYLQKKAKEKPEEYAVFWKEYNRIFKLGYTDFLNADKYMELLRFNSSANEDENGLTSLEEYTGRFQENQKEIYYALGTSRAAIISSPQLEIFRNKGLEVLYLTDPLDEFVLSSIRKYKDYEFKSIDTADLKSIEKLEDKVQKDKPEELNEDDNKQLASLLSRMKDILNDKVENVRVSERLVDSPACLISPDNSISTTMQKLMRLSNKEIGLQKKIFEINKDHSLIRNLLKVFKVDSNDKYITLVTEQLFESALLLEGSLEDPHKLVTRLNELLKESSEWYVEVKKF